MSTVMHDYFSTMIIPGLSALELSAADIESIFSEGQHGVVRVCQLAGHEDEISYLDTNHKKWKATAETQFLNMWRASSRKVLLVGHSTGACLATWLETKHPDKVAGLVLLAPPFGLYNRTQQKLAAFFALFRPSLIPTFVFGVGVLCAFISLFYLGYRSFLEVAGGVSVFVTLAVLFVSAFIQFQKSFRLSFLLGCLALTIVGAGFEYAFLYPELLHTLLAVLGVGFIALFALACLVGYHFPYWIMVSEGRIRPILRPLLRLQALARKDPKHYSWAYNFARSLSKSIPEEYKSINQDERNWSVIPGQAVVSLQIITDEVWKKSDPDCPVLLVLGEEDTVVDGAQAKLYLRRISSRSRKVISMKGLNHEFFAKENVRQVAYCILGWTGVIESDLASEQESNS